MFSELPKADARHIASIAEYEYLQVKKSTIASLEYSLTFASGRSCRNSSRSLQSRTLVWTDKIYRQNIFFNFSAALKRKQDEQVPNGNASLPAFHFL